jgi:hypothetical protein
MHKLKELRKLINQPLPNSGKVVKAGTELLIATNRGSVLLNKVPGDATQYNVGDEVILANGVVVGRRKRNPTVYVL